MKASTFLILFTIISAQAAFAQGSPAEQELITLSKDKWQWMADKNVVGGNEVTNPFMVTEVYIKENGGWKLGSLSFTRLLTPGQ